MEAYAGLKLLDGLLFTGSQAVTGHVDGGRCGTDADSLAYVVTSARAAAMPAVMESPAPLGSVTSSLGLSTCEYIAVQKS